MLYIIYGIQVQSQIGGVLFKVAANKCMLLHDDLIYVDKVTKYKYNTDEKSHTCFYSLC